MLIEDRASSLAELHSLTITIEENEELLNNKISKNIPDEDLCEGLEKLSV